MEAKSCVSHNTGNPGARELGQISVCLLLFLRGGVKRAESVSVFTAQQWRCSTSAKVHRTCTMQHLPFSLYVTHGVLSNGVLHALQGGSRRDICMYVCTYVRTYAERNFVSTLSNVAHGKSSIAICTENHRNFSSPCTSQTIFCIETIETLKLNP